MSTLQLGVLVSGNGSNLQAILDAIADSRLDAAVRLVVSNVPDVRALERAERAGVPSLTLCHGEFSSRELYERRLADVLDEAGVEWVALAGFMRILTSTFLRRFPDRVVNIHPALLPAFAGAHAQLQALNYGVKVAGCTVHFVDEGVDSGPIIAQRTVPVLDDDDEASLSGRILTEEHRAYVEVLQWIAEGRIYLARGSEGSRARVVRQPP